MYEIMKYVGLIVALIAFIVAIVVFFGQRTFEAFKYYANNKERIKKIGNTPKAAKANGKSPKKKAKNEKPVTAGERKPIAVGDAQNVDPNAVTGILGTVENYAEILADASSTTALLPDLEDF